MQSGYWMLACLGSFFSGSIPCGVLIGRARGVDIRAHGSGNVGATNVWRVLGRPWGLLCFTLDVAKGAVPVALAGSIAGLLGTPTQSMSPTDQALWLAVAAAAILGHVFCPWTGFRGGKGVATACGALLAMWPLMTLPVVVALALWAIVAKVSRYVSLASILAALALPLAVLGRALANHAPVESAWPTLAMTLALAALVIYMHKGNISRLRQGTENRISP